RDGAGAAEGAQARRHGRPLRPPRPSGAGGGGGLPSQRLPSRPELAAGGVDGAGDAARHGADPAGAGQKPAPLHSRGGLTGVSGYCFVWRENVNSPFSIRGPSSVTRVATAPSPKAPTRSVSAA